MTPDPHLQEMLAAVAEEAFRRDEKDLALIVTTILGTYEFGGLSHYAKATERYLGSQAKGAVLEAVAKSVAGELPLFSRN